MILGLRSAANAVQDASNATAPNRARRSNEFTGESARTLAPSAIMFFALVVRLVRRCAVAVIVGGGAVFVIENGRAAWDI